VSKWTCSHCQAINPSGAFKCHNCPNVSGDEKWYVSGTTTPQTPPPKEAEKPSDGTLQKLALDRAFHKSLSTTPKRDKNPAPSVAEVDEEIAETYCKSLHRETGATERIRMYSAVKFGIAKGRALQREEYNAEAAAIINRQSAEVAALQEQVKQLTEYKAKYDGLCK
jgi:hypothetical protein